jgi:signal transduction histidine kinase
MSIVAHDLKSPLNRIDGIAYLMGMDGKLDKQLQQYVDMVKNATRNGLDLITDLLDVHMLEENVEPNYSTFDISRFLLEKTEALGPGADAKNIHLNIIRVENEEVFTDRDYLDRIFDNLLSNAIKFSPKNSIVDISADRTEHEFWISIRDRGPGFSNEDKNFLFQKFKKLSARPTGGETSNGLGLAIVKILVDRLKGKIELITDQGKGSEFIIRFPQAKQYA